MFVVTATAACHWIRTALTFQWISIDRKATFRSTSVSTAYATWCQLPRVYIGICTSLSVAEVARSGSYLLRLANITAWREVSGFKLSTCSRMRREIDKRDVKEVCSSAATVIRTTLSLEASHSIQVKREAQGTKRNGSSGHAITTWKCSCWSRSLGKGDWSA